MEAQIGPLLQEHELVPCCGSHVGLGCQLWFQRSWFGLRVQVLTCMSVFLGPRAVIKKGKLDKPDTGLPGYTPSTYGTFNEHPFDTR